MQRVTRASVTVGGEVVGAIGRGAVVFVGVLDGDDAGVAERLALRIARFRFFEDGEGRMNLSALDLEGADEPPRFLVVSQFTLAADGRKGRRPSFDRAARPERARPIYEAFVERLRASGLGVETGTFQAEMAVLIENDGPVTFVLDQEPA